MFGFNRVCYVVTMVHNYYVCTHTCVLHGVHVYILPSIFYRYPGTVGRLLITRVPGTCVPGTTRYVQSRVFFFVHVHHQPK